MEVRARADRTDGASGTDVSCIASLYHAFAPPLSMANAARARRTVVALK